MNISTNPYLVKASPQVTEGIITLPSSKSISNRVLAINALTVNALPVRNLSDSDDTRVMDEVIRSSDTFFDIGHAGTAMRFLTAWLSLKPGDWTITGSERMKQRPIRVLADALVSLGAKIGYPEKEGYPPLTITGVPFRGGTVELDGSVSSQYISALLMIGPVLPGGLTIRLKNKVTSRLYISMTLKLMEQFGVRCSWKNKEITVPEQPYSPREYTIEGDWSAAGYWYEILALCPSGSFILKDLTLSGLQGDEALSHWFTGFGIETQKCEEGIRIRKNEETQPVRIFLNFHENPDLAQTMAVLCVAKRIPFHFIGLETLKIKETDRVAALQAELGKFGALLTEPAEGELKWDGVIHSERIVETPLIETYNDHRMALAFAPLALTGRPVVIGNPKVVSKSYPGFWDDLRSAGFQISEAKAMIL